MQAPVVVLVEYEFYNTGDRDNEVYLFKDIQKAIQFGKDCTKDYLEGRNLTEEDFQNSSDTFEIYESENNYSFVSWDDTDFNRYNVFVYKGEFEDDSPTLKPPQI